MIRLIVDFLDVKSVATSREVPHCLCSENDERVHYHVVVHGGPLYALDVVESVKHMGKQIGASKGIFTTKAPEVAQCEVLF
jgi:hypothetical protein